MIFLSRIRWNWGVRSSIRHSIWARVNFLGGMNWIGIGAVYRGKKPGVKRFVRNRYT